MRSRPLRVLVVDDDRETAESLQMLLELWGYECLAVVDAKQALPRARAFCPDIVLLDLGMPEMDGFQVARQLRQEPITATAKLLALTAWTDSADRLHTMEAGFELHLGKPVYPEELQRVLRLYEKRKDVTH